MPYHIGEKGSYGCSGYPVVKDGTNEVMGCHDSAAAAQSQVSAINISESEKGKKNMGSTIGQPHPASYAQSHFNWSTPVRKPERSSFKVKSLTINENKLEKAMLQEGDFVMCGYEDEITVGRIEYIMTTMGTLGLEDSEYAVMSTEDDYAVLIRVYEQEDGVWEEEDKLITRNASHLTKVGPLMVERDVVVEMGGFGADRSRVQRETYSAE
jgi:hypothetical protein